MNVHHPQSKIWTADEFLRWAEGREGKYEFVGGNVLMMTGGTRRHAELCGRLYLLLHGSASALGLGIAVEWGVRTFAGIRYPDVVIFHRDGPGEELATTEPVFTAEILSPSSLAIDFNEKAAEYTAFSSLRHYLVLAQDEPRVWVWSRNGEGRFGPPEMIAGREETVELPGLTTSLPLADLYQGIA
ncbi:Uma2 family endonuclease [Aureimonas psammosilenae]|uniref:Uma2 family endonuclease n=1 Tax=Aureimonas psammosilenae TaxID=2495496 RepID=UPI0012610784|nr:Uma2 family endonuclease [Aureimonas psammosilenae]